MKQEGLQYGLIFGSFVGAIIFSGDVASGNDGDLSTREFDLKDIMIHGLVSEVSP